MDEDLSIINTNTRNEKIKNFFVNNKNKIISGIIILIIIIVGVFSYDKYLINKKKDISDSYNSIIIDYSASRFFFCFFWIINDYWIITIWDIFFFVN